MCMQTLIEQSIKLHTTYIGYRVLLKFYIISLQLLAGAQVSAVDNHQKGVLHMAVGANSPAILSVLLENGADADACDEEGNTAMHLAMQLGQVHCVKVLIQESNVNLTAMNNRYVVLLYYLHV